MTESAEEKLAKINALIELLQKEIQLYKQLKIGVEQHYEKERRKHELPMR